MPSYFLDTSALIKYYHEEKGTDRVKRIIEGPEGGKVYISELSLVEFRAALFRKLRAGVITIEDRFDATNLLNSDILEGRFLVIPISSTHLQKAIGLLEDHGDRFALRTLDSLQLATALALQEGVKDKLEFVCADQLLLEVAEECGFRPLTPSWPEATEAPGLLKGLGSLGFIVPPLAR